jgi:hypothetical protein
MLNVLAAAAPDHGTNYGYIAVIPVVIIALWFLVLRPVSRWENNKRAARRAGRASAKQMRKVSK